MHAKAIFGDFQTPAALAEKVCARLSAIGIEPSHVVEPTCGMGAFLFSAAACWPDVQLEGFEISAAHLAAARDKAREASLLNRLQLSEQDFFERDWQAALAACPDHTLLLGNPPWITSASLAAADGANLPMKRNFQGLNGLAAKTGKANFDIAEWMLIQLVEAAQSRPFTLAMLCKTATARKVLRDGWLRTRNIEQASLYNIDADDWFGVSVGACLLVLKTGKPGPAIAVVHDTLDGAGRHQVIGLAGKELVSDLPTYQRLRHLDGYSPHVWRSGIKHDCADIMELKRGAHGDWINGLDEKVVIEDRLVFPLLKSTDVAKGIESACRAVIVTQQKPGDDTGLIEAQAPATWRYLCSHHERFTARKSSIYRNRPPFSIFGVGSYSFRPWKIAVSALHRNIRFRVFGPQAGKPVPFDDTCYCLGFDSQEQARKVLAVLQSEACREFMQSLVFADAKRTVTAELLQRLNLQAIAQAAGLGNDWLDSEDQTATIPYPASTPSQAVLVMEPTVEYHP